MNSTLHAYATRAGVRTVLALGLATALHGLTASSSARQPAGSAIPRGHATVTGKADAIDGDTLVLGGIRVRLEGIDAPEIDQTCVDHAGQVWRCGSEARAALAHLVAYRQVTCEERGLDKYKRILAVCRAGGIELNAEMIRRGLAWAFVRYSRSYVADEARARAQRIGIWAGEAQPAWHYRTGSWTTAQSNAPAGCPIKGNVGVNGRIYHMPWSPWYAKVVIDESRGEHWFCSEKDAIAAGWRPAHGS